MLNFVSVHAPQSALLFEQRFNFFTDLAKAVPPATTHSSTLVMGDFNARLGGVGPGEEAWPTSPASPSPPRERSPQRLAVPGQPPTIWRGDQAPAAPAGEAPRPSSPTAARASPQPFSPRGQHVESVRALLDFVAKEFLCKEAGRLPECVPSPTP